MLRLWVMTCVCVHRLAVGDTYDVMPMLELPGEDTDDDMPALEQSF